VFDNPGHIFPDFFGAPGFFDVASDADVEEISIGADTTGSESNDRKTKGLLWMLLASVD
jgi:hypothetical protein